MDAYYKPGNTIYRIQSRPVFEYHRVRGFRQAPDLRSSAWQGNDPSVHCALFGRLPEALNAIYSVAGLIMWSRRLLGREEYFDAPKMEWGLSAHIGYRLI